MKIALRSMILTLLVGSLTLADDERKASEQPKNDQEFLTWAIACDTAEIKAGELAQKMGSNPVVVRLAQKLALDCSNNRATLVAIGKALRMDVAETTFPGAKERAEKLSKTEKGDFDKEYIKAQVEGQQKALKMYETWAKEGKDENIRNLANRSLPVIRNHLELTRRVATDLGVKLPD
jgi:putative membrane protein